MSDAIYPSKFVCSCCKPKNEDLTGRPLVMHRDPTKHLRAPNQVWVPPPHMRHPEAVAKRRHLRSLTCEPAQEPFFPGHHAPLLWVDQIIHYTSVWQAKPRSGCFLKLHLAGNSAGSEGTCRLECEVGSKFRSFTAVKES